MDTLKERLKYVRNLRGLSQKQLSDLIPTSQSTVNDLESGKNKSTKYLLRLADILDVDARWLERGVGSLVGDGVSIVNQGSPLPLYEWNDLASSVLKPSETPSLVDLVHRCPVNHSARAYCLVSTSFHSTGKIGQGEVIFADPVCKYVNGCYVIALVGEMCLLRQLVSDGVGSYLKTTNDNVPSERRVISVNLEALDPGVIDVPTTSKDGVSTLLIGRVVLRQEHLA